MLTLLLGWGAVTMTPPGLVCAVGIVLATSCLWLLPAFQAKISTPYQFC